MMMMVMAVVMGAVVAMRLVVRRGSGSRRRGHHGCGRGVYIMKGKGPRRTMCEEVEAV